MDIKVLNKGNANIAVVLGDGIISNVQDALDLMVTVRYNHGCDKVVINKNNITEDFFELKTGIAGEIMQKFINYGASLAIVGDFEKYDSKSLKALIYESNKSNRILFKSTEEEAVEALAKDTL